MFRSFLLREMAFTITPKTVKPNQIQLTTPFAVGFKRGGSSPA